LHRRRGPGVQGASMGQGGNRLRSRLLVGVATVALSAPFVHRAIAQQMADKFQPHIEAGGFGTNEHSGGDVDMFLPLWQDPTSLLFGDLRGTFTGQPAQSGSFGLGYRTQVDPEWILGGYGFFDLKHTDNDNTFFQGSVGLEALSIDWDFRVNGYFPFNSDSGSSKSSGVGGLNGSGLTIIGTDIGFHSESQQEKALFGVDGEVGWRVPIFPADGDMDLRVFAGGFYFSASDTDTLAGPRGRIELRLYDLDLLGVQSRLTAQGLVQWDDHRGTIGGGGLELRIPLGGFFGQPETKLSAIDRRMVDRVVRDPEVIETRMATKDETRIQDVQVDGLINTPTHKIVFADANGVAGNSGAQGDETTLNAAPGKFPGQNEIIVAQGNEGDIHVSNPVQLQNGQSLLGGGTPVGVTLVGGPNDGHHIIFTPPGTTPNVVGNDNTKNLIEMASGSQNRITGLSMTGQFLNAIHGLNMYRAVITDNFGSGGAANGVFLEQSEPGAQPSSTIYIARNTLAGNGSDGILLRNGFSDGLSHLQFVGIFENTVAGNGDDGIAVSSTASGAGTALNQYLDVIGNAATGNADDGFRLANVARDGGTLLQGLAGARGRPAVIAYNFASANGDDGFSLVGLASGAGARVSQALLVRGNVASSNGGEGILMIQAGYAGGAVTQATHVYLNQANGNAVDGIAFANQASGAGGSVSQDAVLFANTADGNGSGGHGPRYQDGIILANYGFGGGAVRQSVAVLANRMAQNAIDGLGIANIVRSGGSIVQLAEVSGNIAEANASRGIYLLNRAGTTSGAVTAGGSILQFLSGSSNIAVANGGDGLRLQNAAYFAGSTISQSVALADGVFSGNSGNGVAFRNGALGGAAISQAVAIDPSTITFNSGSGVYGVNRINVASLNQTIALLDDTISYNGSDGVRLLTPTADASSLSQALSIVGNRIVGNASNGVFVSATANNGSTVSQNVLIAGNSIAEGAGSGVFVRANGGAGTSIAQSVGVSGNTVELFGGRGIYVRAAVYGSGSGALTQSLSIGANTIASVGGAGISVFATEANGASFGQNVTMAGNVVGNVGGTGIAVGSILKYVSAPATAAISITSNSVTSAAIDGIAVALTLRETTLSEPVFAIDGNSIARVGTSGSVGGIGIYLRNNMQFGGVLTQGALAGSPATIDGNAIGYAVSGGISVGNHVRGAGATLSQALSVDGNTVQHVHYAGIRLATGAYTAPVVQSIAIDNNTVADVQALGGARTAVGIAVANGAGDATSAGAITQTLSITGNSVTGIGNQVGTQAQSGFGVLVTNAAGINATISQSASIAENAVANVYGFSAAAGIANFNIAGQPGAAISQTIGIDDNTVVNVDGGGIVAGIHNINLVFGGAAVSQALTIDPNTILDIAGGDASAAVGILNVNHLEAGATLTQAALVSANLVSQVGAFATAAGIMTYNQVSAGGFLSQSLSIIGNQVSSVAVFQTSGLAAGIAVLTYLRGAGGSSAASVQTVEVSGNAVDSVNGAGIKVRDGLTSAAMNQSALGIDGNTVTNVSLVGIYASTVLWSGSVLTQGLTIDANSIAHVAADRYGNAFGVIVNNLVKPGSFLSQTLSATGNRISDVSGAEPGLVAGFIETMSLDGAPGTSASAVQSVDISGNTISGITGGLGIAVQNVLKHATLTETTLAIDRNTVADVSQAGIYVIDILHYGSTLSQGLTIRSNAVSQVAADTSFRQGGIVVYVGGDAGSVLSQTVSIDGNRISNVTSTSQSAAGIALLNDLYGSAGSGASAVQSVDISGNSIANIQASSGLVAGIEVVNAIGTLGESATQSQTLSITGNTITHVGDLTSAHALYGFGILVSNFAGSLSTITQSATIAANSIAGVYGSARAVGIENFNHVTSTGVISQTIGIDDNTVASVHGTGIVAGIDVYNQISGGTVSQALTIDPNTIRDIGGSSAAIAGGILVQNGMRSGALSQTVDITSNNVAGVTAGSIATGIAVYTRARSGALVVQAIVVSGNGVSDIAETSGRSGSAAGISVITYAHGVAGNDVQITQSLFVNTNTLTGVAGYAGNVAGIAVLNEAQSGFISQDLVVTSNSATSNAGTGILLVNRTANSDGVILQRGATSSDTALIASNFVAGNGGDGIALANLAGGGGYILQGVSLGFNTVRRNSEAGVSLLASAGGGGSALQAIFAEGNEIGHNNVAGLRVGAYGPEVVQGVVLTKSGSGNFITSNGFGVFANANHGVVQVISLYSNLGSASPQPNVIQGNTPNLFKSAANASLQVVKP
jgi:uncharacterized protein YuzE